MRSGCSSVGPALRRALPALAPSCPFPRAAGAPGLGSAGALGAGVRAFSSGMDPVKIRRLKASGICFNRPRGRDMATDMFEEKIHLVPCDDFAAVMDGWTDTTVAVDLVRADEVEAGDIPASSPLAPFYERHGQTTFSLVARRNMRRNGDTWATTYGARSQGASTDAGTTALAAERRSIVHCVDPVIAHQQYRREEAQVELMTAYRNVLYEVYDLAQGGLPVTVVRIPALSLAAASVSRFHKDIGKLNQQALVKGFHRVPNGVKDWYSCQPALRVELYVPRSFVAEFEAVFSEEPWEVPKSAFTAPRGGLYPGLPVPEGLLEYPGWTGQRPEILQAVETEGRSLTDGIAAEQYDVFKNAK